MIVIYAETLLGHYLEYVHHIYEIAAKDKKNNYVFLLPNEFDEIKGELSWQNSNNIVFHLYEQLKLRKSKNNFLSLLYESFLKSVFVRKIVKEYSADTVFSISLIDFVPFAPILISRKIRLSGIIYRIFLYDYKNRSRHSFFIDKIKYFILSKSRIFNNIFVLNDKDGAMLLNRIFHTNKFLPIPDPYFPLDLNGVADYRANYSIGYDKILFVHFGSLNANKGTLAILKSLEELSSDECEKYVFAFAGKIHEEIKEEFDTLVSVYNKRIRIIVENKFCSFNHIASLCSACNAIVLPYKRVAQSSGLIGYASQMRKPVIAPRNGLLGKLVKKYALGITVKDVTPFEMCEAYRKIENNEYETPTQDYCNDNNVELFQKTICEFLN